MMIDTKMMIDPYSDEDVAKRF